MWDVINFLFLKLVDHSNFNQVDAPFVKELLDQKNKLYLDVEWFENDPLKIDLCSNEHPTIVLFKVFSSLNSNTNIESQKKILIENLLIHLKWFCEKLNWSTDSLLIEPMEIDI